MGRFVRLVVDRYVCSQLMMTKECGRVEDVRHGSREHTPRGRDQIREQDATGQSRIDRDGCDVDAASSATKGDGGDASDGLRPGSLCS